MSLEIKNKLLMIVANCVTRRGKQILNVLNCGPLPVDYLQGKSRLKSNKNNSIHCRNRLAISIDTHRHFWYDSFSSLNGVYKGSLYF